MVLESESPRGDVIRRNKISLRPLPKGGRGKTWWGRTAMGAGGMGMERVEIGWGGDGQKKSLERIVYHPSKPGLQLLLFTRPAEISGNFWVSGYHNLLLQQL